jgi:hypothetical protein
MKTHRLLAQALGILVSSFALGARLGQAQTYDIMSFDTTATGPWSEVTNTTLIVPKVPNGSIKLDASISSAEYGGFQGAAVIPGVNAWILNYPTDRNWNGPADSSFTFYLAHDDNYLYVGVDAKDDVVNSDDPPASFWKDDAIEIVVDAFNDRLDNNTDSSDDPYGGHCYVNFWGKFSRWDETTGTINGKTWSSAVDWTYGENKDIFGFGKQVAGGWKMEACFHKRLFVDPAVNNKLDNGHRMGFNIGLDDDDKRGVGLNGDHTRTADLEIQYFWANRLRHKGLTPAIWAQLTPDQQADQTFLDSAYPLGIDPNGRLSHGGMGEIIFAGVPALVKLNLAKSSTNVQLNWTGTGTLEEADKVTGPWSLSNSQNNPQTLVPAGSAKFYRIRQ